MSDIDYETTDIVYDLETYPNIFTFGAIFANGKGERVYEISTRKNEVKELIEFLRKVKTGGYRLVGFNNLGFDYPVLHHLLLKSKEARDKGVEIQISAHELYKVAQGIIDSMKFNRFGSNIRNADVLVPQVDLFKIHHFDNSARSTSLKMLEFNMRSDSIEDLPYPVGKILKDEEMDVLIHYNKKDINETLKFYRHSIDHIRLRTELTKTFGFDCTNFNDTKIGKELFVNRLEKNRPGCCYKMVSNGKGGQSRKIQQTKRSKIALRDCVLPYVRFDRPEFQAIHKWFMAQTIKETNGVFSDLEEHHLGDVAKYAEMIVKRQKMNDPVDKKNKRYVPTQEHINQMLQQHPMGWIEEKELKSPKGAKSYWFCWHVSETLNVVIDGFRYDFGTGGIHGCKKGVSVSGNGKKIYTLDVASYYPNLSIRNKIYPEHLDVLFCEVYEGLYVERRSYDKKHALNKALKLALNGTYGASGDEFSPMFDPQFMMSITINGQLLLCMLMETLIREVGAEIIMCNTDGFEFIADETQKEKIDALVKQWETLTGLTMEGDAYQKMMAANVNNYIAVFESGDVKRKGAYEYKDLDWHKNQSALVIKMAAVHQLLGKGDAAEFIRNHKDEYDFMLRTKVPRSSKLILEVEDDVTGIPQEVPLQNICRYYPSVQGGKLVKIMPPLASWQPGGLKADGSTDDGYRRLSIDKEWNVTPCNNMVDFKWGVNYDYYIAEAQKLIDAIMGDSDLYDGDVESD